MHLATDYQLFYASNADYVYGKYIHRPDQGVTSSFRSCKIFEYSNELGHFYPGEKTFTIKVIYNGSVNKNTYFNDLLNYVSRKEMGTLRYSIVNYGSGGSYSIVEEWNLDCKIIGVSQIDAENDGVYSLELKFYAPRLLWYSKVDTVDVKKFSDSIGFKGENGTGYTTKYDVNGLKMIGRGWKIEDVSADTRFRVYETYLDPDEVGTLTTILTVKTPYMTPVDVEIDYPNHEINYYTAISNYCNPFIELPIAFWSIDAPLSTQWNFSKATIYVYELRGMPPWK